MTAGKDIWEGLAELAEDARAGHIPWEVPGMEGTTPGAGGVIAWMDGLPEYLAGLQEAGRERPICLLTQVMNTRILMPVRLAAAAHGEEPDPNRGADPLETVISLAVPECETGRVQRVLDEGVRSTIRERKRVRSAASTGRVAEVLAGAEGAGWAQHQLIVQDGERLREIYGEDRVREAVLRIVRRKNRISGHPTRVTDRRGTRLVR